jgi:hypothetical protein
MQHTCSCYVAAVQAQLQLNSKVVPVECLPQPRGTITCCYTAPAAGLGVLQVTAGGRHLRGSPFSVKVMTIAIES